MFYCIVLYCYVFYCISIVVLTRVPKSIILCTLLPSDAPHHLPDPDERSYTVYCHLLWDLNNFFWFLKLCKLEILECNCKGMVNYIFLKWFSSFFLCELGCMQKFLHWRFVLQELSTLFFLSPSFLSFIKIRAREEIITAEMDWTNIVRIAKRCPENITSVVKYVKLLFPKVLRK